MVGVISGGHTDIGMVRASNEDHLYVGTHVWAVSDGMGGHAAGEIASEIVIDHLRDIDSSNLEQSGILKALERANGAVLDYGMRHPEASGLGCTVTGLAQVSIGGSPHWAVFNIGDSRVYRQEHSLLQRATVDHSEVQELISQGVISAEQGRHHVLRNVLTRSIGTDPGPSVDLWVLPQAANVRFLICSDGLTGELTDGQINALLSEFIDPGEAARALVEAAKAAGGSDNISVVVVNVDGDNDRPVDEITQPRAGRDADGDA